MVLNYQQKINGLYILDKEDIDEIATMTLNKYLPNVLTQERSVDIEALAENSLFLTIRYEAIAHEETILGAIALDDSEGVPCYGDKYQTTKTALPAGTVLINSCLLEDASKSRLRFTIAHEAAHWLLHRSYYSPTNQQYKFREQRLPYIACRDANFKPIERHKLKTDEEWMEWQANALAASLLMPLAPFRSVANWALRVCDRNYLSPYADRELIEEIAKTFMVSRTAADVRLKQLGYIQAQ